MQVQKFWNGLPFDKEVDVPLQHIESDPDKVRPVDEERVTELMASFKSKGQRQAIEVRPLTEFRARVTFGEHRFEAASRLNWPTIRAVIKRVDELEALELKVTENAQRNHYVDPWEEGKIFVRLISEKYHGDLNALAESIGKGTAYVGDRITVYYRLDPKLRDFVGKQLTVTNAISLAKVSPKEKQADLAAAIIKTKTKAGGGMFGQGGGFGGGGYGGLTRVRMIHKCTCGCGDIHEDRRGSVMVDLGEDRIVRQVIFGYAHPNFSGIKHIQRPDEEGVSYCGRQLGDRWAGEMPKDLNAKEIREKALKVCFTCVEAETKRC